MRVYLSPEFRQLGIVFSAPRPGDAGYDLYTVESGELQPGQSTILRTGLHVEIPAGFVGIVKDRSSMALRGLQTSGGVIDAGYRGEIKVVIRNLSESPQRITQGQKFAQMLVVPCFTEAIITVESLEQLSITDRGTGGFGSTGG
jgi:dUTP pyrophosphatase